MSHSVHQRSFNLAITSVVLACKFTMFYSQYLLIATHPLSLTLQNVQYTINRASAVLSDNNLTLLWEIRGTFGHQQITIF